MSLTSRARAIHKRIPHRAHQQIVTDIRRLRMRPEHDGRYILAWSSRHTLEVTCTHCGAAFPIGFDKHGVADEEGRTLCDACRFECDTAPCIRCGGEMVGSGGDFCGDCNEYIRSPNT